LAGILEPNDDIRVEISTRIFVIRLADVAGRSCFERSKPDPDVVGRAGIRAVGNLLKD
jgi:hypothetical protein